MRLLLPALLSACTGKGLFEDAPDNDLDNDGFDHDSDCNDEDVLIHPDAPELCDGIDNDCDGEVDEDGAVDAPTHYADSDGDGHGDPDQTAASCTLPEGFSESPLDCDDGDPAVSPDADEVCDGVDNDCDGLTDEGSALDIGTFYADSDGDGYGSLHDTATACAAPSGYVADPGDCDDFDSSVHPDADEVCDGADNDCDGLYDDADDSLTDPDRWYLDRDGDGYGTTEAHIDACAQPSGYAEASSFDCDDEAETTHPDADELCGDGEDNNCDGAIDEESAPDLLAWYEDADADDFGAADGVPVVQCSQPAGRVADSADCDDDDATINPQASEVWYDGVDQDCDGLSDYDADNDGYDSDVYGGDDCDDALIVVHPGYPEVCGDGVDNDCDDDTDPCTLDATLHGTANYDALGSAVAGGGDWDGDEYDDLLLGAPLHDSTGVDMGAVYVVSGPITGSSDVGTTNTTYLYGEASGDRLGSAVAGVGDINDSGYDDILLGAPGYDGASGGATDSGAFYLQHGPSFGTVPLATGKDIHWWGEASYDMAGSALSGIGDFDSDGELDFLIGAYRQDSAATDAGAVYILLGPVTTTGVSLASADVKLSGTAASEWAGHSVSGGGDLDGDGYDDVLVGAPGLASGTTNPGGAYVVDGEESPASGSLSAAVALTGVTHLSETGASVSVGGDTNGDGYDDVLIGAPAESGGSGIAYLMHGPISSATSVIYADAIFITAEATAALGSAVAIGGDADGDGRDDVLLGAPGSDLAGTDAGAAYVLLAPQLGTSSVEDAAGAILGAAAADAAGTAVAFPGDINQDDYDDVLVGVPGNDAGSLDGGLVWLTLGGGW